MTENGNLFKQVTLDNIANGAVKELFDREMQNVAKNIADPNIQATAKRTITISVRITPNENRENGSVLVDVGTKLPGVKPATAPIWFGKGAAGPAAYQNDPQMALPGATDEVPNIGRNGHD
jgi:hypothetical protein